MQLIIATTNDHKISEIKEILDSDIDILTYNDFADWPEVAETGQTFKDNAIIKAKTLADKYHKAAIADDSGLVVEALGGQPGVFSSRYAGIDADDEQNVKKLLENLKSFSNKTAAFVTVVAFVDKEENQLLAEGRVSGKIINEPKGTSGFGYDPVFVPDGFKQTFGQMSAEEKNKLSHRGQAFGNLKAVMQEKGYL